MIVKVVGGYWFLYKINTKLPYIKISQLTNKKIKEDNKNIKLQEAKFNWNYWQFQLYWGMGIPEESIPQEEGFTHFYFKILHQVCK